MNLPRKQYTLKLPGDTDETRDIIRKLQDRIDTILRAENPGYDILGIRSLQVDAEKNEIVVTATMIREKASKQIRDELRASRERLAAAEKANNRREIERELEYIQSLKNRIDAALEYEAREETPPAPLQYRSCDDCGHEWYGRNCICPSCNSRHSGIEREPQDVEGYW